MKYIDLWNCPKCKGKTNTFRHPFAKVWCTNCGYILRNEGDQTIRHKDKKK
jgi:ribosomal protein S27E